MKNNEKIVKCIVAALMIGVIFVGLMTACAELEPKNNTDNWEEPHLYWKEIDVEVTDVVKKHWFAQTHRYVLDVTVHSAEYNLTKTFSETGSGAFGAPSHWNVERGSVIKAKLYSWVMDSTGEVVRREIHHLI